MEQLIQAFGIDARLIVIQIINFIILMAVLSYFLYKPILRLLNDREERIKQGYKDSEAAAAAMSQAESDKQAVLSAVHKEAEEIGKRAKKFADEKSLAILDEARERASDLVRDAESQASVLKQQAQKESEQEIAKLAVLAAEKILKERSS